MDDILLSIIIPYYNLPEYLPKLLSTIPNHSQVEALVIDDHSTRGMEAYEQVQKDFSGRNIRFLLNDAGMKGTSSARNKGIMEARGEFLFFADADDFLAEDFWKIVSPYLTDDSDMVIFNRKKQLEASDSSDRVDGYERTVTEAARNKDGNGLLKARFRLYSMCGRIVRRDIMTSLPIQFPPVLWGEDSVCSVLCGYYMPRVRVVDEVVYHVLRRSNSMSMQKSGINKHTTRKMLLFTYFFTERKMGLSVIHKIGLARRNVLTCRLKMLYIGLYELAHGRIPYPSYKNLSNRHYPFNESI